MPHRQRVEVLPGDPPVTVRLRRSARARRLSLRVSGVDGRAVLTMPLRAPWHEGLAFLASREAWLRGVLARAPAPWLPAPGGEVPFEGGTLRLVPAASGRPRIEGGALLCPGGPERLVAGVRSALLAAARERLASACDRHAAALGRGYGRLSLRDPRSRWGSCSARGDLMFSWRLVLAPPPVLDYVAAHEVAHLARMDHSPAFWAVVEGLWPGHAAPDGPRAWLRGRGAELHRLRLGRDAPGTVPSGA